MKFYAVLTKGGKTVARNVQAEDEPGVRVQYDMRCKVVVELTRPLTDFDSVGLDGVIVEETVARKDHARSIIDRDYCELHGPGAIEEIRRFKALRAERVLDGGSCLLIEGEAELRGITPPELATVIIEHHVATTIENELARIAAKLAVEEGGLPAPVPEAKQRPLSGT